MSIQQLISKLVSADVNETYATALRSLQDVANEATRLAALGYSGRAERLLDYHGINRSDYQLLKRK